MCIKSSPCGRVGVGQFGAALQMPLRRLCHSACQPFLQIRMRLESKKVRSLVKLYWCLYTIAFSFEFHAGHGFNDEIKRQQLLGIQYLFNPFQEFGFSKFYGTSNRWKDSIIIKSKVDVYPWQNPKHPSWRSPYLHIYQLQNIPCPV